MTYRELFQEIRDMTQEQYESDVTIKTLDKEYFPVELSTKDTGGILDENHPYFIIKEK